MTASAQFVFPMENNTATDLNVTGLFENSTDMGFGSLNATGLFENTTDMGFGSLNVTGLFENTTDMGFGSLNVTGLFENTTDMGFGSLNATGLFENTTDMGFGSLNATGLFENTTDMGFGSLNVTGLFENTTDMGFGDSARHKIAEWLDEYAIYVLTAVALLGNTVTVVTICNMKPLTSTSIYIVALATTDTAFLVLKLMTVRLVRYPSLPQEVSCGFLFGMFLFAQYTASWLIVVISLERFVAVWFPLRVSLVSTKRKACLVLVIVSVVFIVPSFWTFWVYARIDHPYWGVVCVPRQRYDGFMKVIDKAHPVLYIILPFVLILIINCLIIIGMTKARRFGQNLDGKVCRARGRYKMAARMTVMLLTTAIVFLILELMMVILTLFRHYGSNGKEAFINDYFFVEVAQSLEDANHAVNFFLYVCSGVKFREAFVRLVKGKACRTPTHPRQLTWSSRMSSYRVSTGTTTGDSVKMVARQANSAC